MSSAEWICQHCGYGPMSCLNDKICLLCQDPQLPGDCDISKPSLSGLPRHPPSTRINVSRGIAVGRKPHTGRGGRRHKRTNKSRKNKRKHM
jgi:hypothetical protein